MTITEAKNTEIFIINDEQKVEKTTLYEHVLKSVEETTSPRGVEPKLHIRYNGRASFDLHEIESEEKIIEEDPKWEVWTWGIRGNHPVKLHGGMESFETADDKLFELIYKKDYMPDDQRDTWYTQDKNEAEKVAAERKESLS